MQVGTVSCTISTNDTKAFVFVADRTANTVAVRTACSVTLVFTQVLNSEVQAINQTKEVGVTGNDSNLLIVFYVQRAFTDKQQIKRKAQSFD